MPSWQAKTSEVAIISAMPRRGLSRRGGAVGISAGSAVPTLIGGRSQQALGGEERLEVGLGTGADVGDDLAGGEAAHARRWSDAVLSELGE